MSNIIEIEVFNKLFTSIADEMGIILEKSSFSPNIKERRDFSCAFFDARGELVAQAAHIPVHLGAMPLTVKETLATHSLSFDDILILNDPFKGGSHLPDITLMEAVCDMDGKVLFYVVNRAHHADVGGKTPGSMGFTTSPSEEGVLIPPTYLFSRGTLNKTFLNTFLNKVRNPTERQGDLRAQIASLKRGKQRLTELVNKFGYAHLYKIISQLKDYAERLMRKEITNIPDGRYSYTDFLDDDGQKSAPIPISIDLTINGSSVRADFSKSADQIITPFNAVESVTLSATTYVFLCLLGEGHLVNQGSYRPIRLITRKGSIVDARPPAPVAAGNVETSQRIVDVLLGALSGALPNRIPAASCGSMNNLAIGSLQRERNEEYAYYETIGGGMGARPGLDGLSGIHTHMTNTMNTPIEALEYAFPLEVEHYRLRKKSGGIGLYRGGDGISRSYRFLERAHVSLLAERQQRSPYGLAGGNDGQPGQNILHSKKKRKILPGKIDFIAESNDLLTINTPGGGGWGQTIKKASGLTS